MDDNRMCEMRCKTTPSLNAYFFGKFFLQMINKEESSFRVPYEIDHAVFPEQLPAVRQFRKILKVTYFGNEVNCLPGVPMG